MQVFLAQFRFGMEEQQYMWRRTPVCLHKKRLCFKPSPIVFTMLKPTLALLLVVFVIGEHQVVGKLTIVSTVKTFYLGRSKYLGSGWLCKKSKATL